MATKPLRTCIGCYQTASKDELIRIVKLSDNSMAVELNSKENGRGAYVCPDIDCISKAMRLEKLNRAFRIVPGSSNQIASGTIERARKSLLEFIKH
jgi:hypothetical protein